MLFVQMTYEESNETLRTFMQKHPRISRGFSFLGYEFNASGLAGIAKATREKFVERIRQLYEQGATLSRIGDYVRRWLIWVRSGLSVARDSHGFVFATLRPVPSLPIPDTTH